MFILPASFHHDRHKTTTTTVSPDQSDEELTNKYDATEKRVTRPASQWASHTTQVPSTCFIDFILTFKISTWLSPGEPLVCL